MYLYLFIARVVKLVDTQDLKSCAFIGVPVRFRPRAPYIKKKPALLQAFFWSKPIDKVEPCQWVRTQSL